MCEKRCRAHKLVMNTLCGLLILSFAISSYAAGLEPHIVGGTDAPNGKYPYQASLRFLNRHVCGGSIITDRHILTAGHCIRVERMPNVTVHLGTNNLSESGDVYRIKRTIVYPTFHRILLFNDTAVIELTKKIIFSKTVQPIELASEEIPAGTTAIVSGWGRISRTDKTTLVLQHLNRTVISSKECAQGIYYKNTICTKGEKGSGACFGDSGGPLVANNVQIGIASYITGGRGCASGNPDVYTKVSAFKNWVTCNTIGKCDNNAGDTSGKKGSDNRRDDGNNGTAHQLSISISLTFLCGIVALFTFF